MKKKDISLPEQRRLEKQLAEEAEGKRVLRKKLHLHGKTELALVKWANKMD